MKQELSNKEENIKSLIKENEHLLSISNNKDIQLEEKQKKINEINYLIANQASYPRQDYLNIMIDTIKQYYKETIKVNINKIENHINQHIKNKIEEIKKDLDKKSKENDNKYNSKLDQIKLLISQNKTNISISGAAPSIRTSLQNKNISINNSVDNNNQFDLYEYIDEKEETEENNNININNININFINNIKKNIFYYKKF